MFPSAGAAEAAAVTSLYNRIAEDYDHALPVHITEHYLHRRVDLIGQYLPSGTILDVGCGTGRLAARLMEYGYSAVGLDASIGMLEVMSKQTSVVAVAGYAQALPFRTDNFDLVLSIASLHHIADPSRVATTIAEMHRVTRRGGFVIIWDHNPLNPYWPLIMRRVPQDSGDERLISLGEILRTLHGLGVQKIEAKRMGFVPDFVPQRAMPLIRLLEQTAERVPLLRKIAAHNVLIARKV